MVSLPGAREKLLFVDNGYCDRIRLSAAVKTYYLVGRVVLSDLMIVLKLRVGDVPDIQTYVPT